MARSADPSRIEIEPAPGRLRALWNGTCVAESARALVLRERGHAPVPYFPREDVRVELLEPSGRRTHCPFKGDASYWSLCEGGRRADDAVWSYEEPFEEVDAIRGHLAFYPDRVTIERLP
ncbi:MAG: DUF427 domain-containing protein [Myxococcota bacterium]|nr:DUF427 domain-containing protein [Myxococcota bacterium]